MEWMASVAARAPRAVSDRLTEAVGGPARRHVIAVLAGVLALNGADIGAVAATADDLKHAFGIGTTEIGILVSTVALAGAGFTLPFGILTDRVTRTRLLAAGVATWAVAMIATGAAESYVWLLGARVALGVVTACAGPAVASLTGDFFPASERARMYGFILGGELVGAALGIVVSGNLAPLLGWRYAFWWLVVPAVPLVWALLRLREPDRSGGGGLEPDGRVRQTTQTTLAARAVGRTGVEANSALVLRRDPAQMPLLDAVRYVLRVRTNVVIIVASGLGYFYFAGLRAFAILFATGHYHLGKPGATALLVVLGGGALAGIVIGGRVGDALMRRGFVNGRVLVPSICLLAVPFLLGPGIATTSLWLAVPLLTVAMVFLGAPNPVLDAARLEIIHPHLWGRAESVRTVLRLLGEAGAPTIFGFAAQHVFGGRQSGLESTFLVFLVALTIAGLLALLGLRTYSRDVATAAASVGATSSGGQASAEP